MTDNLLRLQADLNELARTDSEVRVASQSYDSGLQYLLGKLPSKDLKRIYDLDQEPPK